MLKDNYPTNRSLVRMIAIIVFLAVAASSPSLCFSSEAQAKKTDPYQSFYTANHNYESGDYLKAIEGYIAILDQGLESGSLYYNIGNSFLKLGRLGHAILCYERARRLIPHDSDLKANMAYAISLADSANDGSTGSSVTRLMDAAFGSYNIREMILITTVLYLILIVLAGIFIANPFAARKLKIPIILLTILFVISFSASSVRYFNERILRHGIVVVKEAACKYEPIDKSTTYYSLREGALVRILNTRDEWRHIARSDGKIGWVKKDAVEEI